MKNFKRVLSLIMTLIIMMSTFLCLDFSAFATSAQSPAVIEPTTETENVTQEPTVEPTIETVEGTQPLPTDEPTEAPILTPTQTPTQTTATTDKVGKVGKLYKDSKSTNQIKFYWNPVKGAQGYRIYSKNNDKDSTYKLLTTTTGTKITIKNLPHTTPFQFKVAAYITERGVIYEGEAQVGKTATQPAAVAKPKLNQSASNSIKFTWKKNSKADGYKIYRQDSSTKGKLVLYKTIKKNSTVSFTDKKVKAGRAYNYQVRAYREMYKGKTYTGTGTTLRTVAGLCSPKLVKCTTQLRRVTIDWKANAQADGYHIYYTNKKGGTFKLLKTTKSTYLNTDRLKAGYTYYFRIMPYKYVGAKKTKVTGTYLPLNKKVTSTAYGKNPGKTYIEISITQQHMWFYVNGKLYVSTDVVTGNVGYYATPKGYHKIWQRSSPATLTGPTWSSFVNYWMAFTYSGCGIHDASWRSASEYGGTTYMGNGSHGCVNTPYNAVKKIYSKAKMGTPVIIY